jgi:Zn-dependent protease with chaperone function
LENKQEGVILRAMRRRDAPAVVIPGVIAGRGLSRMLLDGPPRTEQIKSLLRKRGAFSRQWKRSALSICVLAGLVIAAGSRCRAQDDEEEGDFATQATLTVHFSARGDSRALLYLPKKPEQWEPVRAALSRTLHCPESQFSNPEQDFPERLRKSISEKQWRRYQQSVAEYNQREMGGSCKGTLAADGGLRKGSLELGGLGEALAPLGITALGVTISTPAAAFHDFSAEGQARRPEESYAAYNFPLDKAVPAIRIAFGFRQRDLRSAGLIALGFVFVPILIIFWMRQLTLKSGGGDPFAAWFSYHRTVNWCVTGTILLWGFSDFHARRNLDNYVGFRWGDAGILQPLVIAALLFIPILIVYAAGVGLSFQVFVRLRSTDWKRGDYLLEQLLQGGASLLPLMFLLAGFLVIMKQAQVGIVCFMLALVSRWACTTWRMRVSKTFPEALTTGELRDKIFDLAKRAAVKVRQVFVLPAGKGQIANAFAAKNNLVIFTDYLLQKLTKREVNYVAAHELTHLQKGHPGKLTLALLAAIFTPAWSTYVIGSGMGMVMGLVAIALPRGAGDWMGNWFRVWGAFEAWSFHDLVLIALGFSGFYYLAQRCEFTADAGAIALTGDPEAAITGLLKINRLNLMPVQWSKVSGAWLTHPTTLHRIERIAVLGGVAPDRLRQILEQYSSPAGLAATEEHYVVPALSQDGALSTFSQSSRARLNLWILIVFHWLPAVAVAMVVERMHWQGEIRMIAFVAGLALTLEIYMILIRWLGLRGRAEIQAQLRRKARAEGIDVEGIPPIVVGLSPAATPRFYVTSYNWDTGLLLLSRDRLYFVGRQLRCSLARDQVEEVRMGPGAPSWISNPRVYLRWKDPENGRQGTFNLASAEPCSARKLSARAHELWDQLTRWKQGSVQIPPVPQLEALGSPALGEVTSISPKALTSPGKSLRLLFFLVLPVAVAACVLLRVQSIWYVCAATLLVRIFEMLPHWRYRERPVFENK